MQPCRTEGVSGHSYPAPVKKMEKKKGWAAMHKGGPLVHSYPERVKKVEEKKGWAAMQKWRSVGALLARELKR